MVHIILYTKRGQILDVHTCHFAHTKTEKAVPPTSACRPCRKSSSVPSSTPGTTRETNKNKNKKRTSKEYNQTRRGQKTSKVTINQKNNTNKHTQTSKQRNEQTIYRQLAGGKTLRYQVYRFMAFFEWGDTFGLFSTTAVVSTHKRGPHPEKMRYEDSISCRWS